MFAIVPFLPKAKSSQEGIVVVAGPAARGHRADLAVVGESLQGALGHGVDGERRGEGLDVQDVGRLGVLGPGARPQQALRARAGVEGPLPAWRVEEVPI